MLKKQSTITESHLKAPKYFTKKILNNLVPITEQFVAFVMKLVKALLTKSLYNYKHLNIVVDLW